MNDRSGKDDDTISGLSATHFISKDDSLASLLLNHGIKVRDFILLSFLSDQGPMTVSILARVVGVEPEKTLSGLRRLYAANLVQREQASTRDELESVARLTARGEYIARRISEQLE
jgi:DNA-binding MarR family transcriptional regulator